MIGLVIPLAYVILEMCMYYAFRRWKAKVESDLEIYLRSVHPERNATNIAVLRFSQRRIKAIWGIVLFLIAFFLTLALYVGLGIPAEPRGDLFERVLAMTLVMCICGSGTWLVLLEPVGNIRVVTESGIFKRSPWTGISFISWGQIESVRWIPILDNFFVKFDSGIFAVNPVYENLNKFAEGIMKNLPRSKWIHAEKKLQKALGGPFQP